jgi:pimeloyl-ACP methyl ester carboxylesterase
MPAVRASSGPVVPVIRQLRLADVEIAWTEIASEDAGGAPLVLLHGLTGHRDDFLPVLPAIHVRHPSLALLAPDLRGHGDSTHGGDPARFGFARLVEDLRDFLDRRDIARCHLLGHSFGGMVALRFALEARERLASLVLVGTAPFAPRGYSVETFEKSGALAVARGMAFLQARIEERARSAEPTRAADRAALRWADTYWPHHRHRFRSMDPVAYRELGLAMVRQTSVAARLGELALPVSVLVGVDDEEFLEGADRLARDVPGAVRVDLPEAGHHPHRENPLAFLDALSSHLARCGVPRVDVDIE